MSVVWTIVLVAVLIVLMAVQSYFLFGPGRRLTVGDKDHWWNKPISRYGRRLLGGVIAVAAAGFLVYDLVSRQRSVGGWWVLDVLAIVAGALVAAGILPRNRSGADGHRTPDSSGPDGHPQGAVPASGESSEGHSSVR